MSRIIPALTLLLGCNTPVVVESYLAVIHISPSNGSVDIDPQASVVITFSEALDPDSVGEDTVYLEDDDGDVVPASLEHDYATVLLTSDQPLEPVTTYQLVLTTGLVGLSSGALTQQISTEFTTRAADADRAPIADAGDDLVVSVGLSVGLDGTGSDDPDGDPIAWAWSVQVRPDGSEASLEDPTLSRPTFVPDVVGTYVFALTVDDGQRSSEADYVQVLAEAGGQQRGTSARPR